jgi:hypothetical protein
MDNYSYILCRYNSDNLLETKISSFLEINNVYEYLINQFNFLDEDTFHQSYLDYVNNYITTSKIILRNHILSFESLYYSYELYVIDINSSYALLTFNKENLIDSVETFDSHENALDQMKKNYSNTFNDDNITTTSDILMIPNNGSVFGMIFKCNNMVG